jgi:hypothetical protein
MTGVLDTNVALYLLGGRLAEPLPAGEYGVSVITEMEMLAWPALMPEDEVKVRQFLGRVVIYDLIPLVRERAVMLCRAERLKLPDAIVAATALVHGVDLWSNDARLTRVPGLRCRTVTLLP